MKYKKMENINWNLMSVKEQQENMKLIVKKVRYILTNHKSYNLSNQKDFELSFKGVLLTAEVLWLFLKYSKKFL